MACGNMLYTLVGFAAEIDWRPLHFVKPVPEARVCSACGLVRTKTALLPCKHILCGSCCDQCAPDGERVCPLDGLRSPEEDAEWKEWPAEEVLKREVKCWNKESGCTAVVAASEIFQHFQRDCRHHSAHCPKCSASVLCSDVCAHLRSNCANLRAPTASECTGETTRSDSPIFLTSSQRVLEKHAGEMGALLKQLIYRGSSAPGDRLSEASHGQGTFTETVKRELPQTTREIVASSKQMNQSTINLSSKIGASEGTFESEIVNVMGLSGEKFSQLAAAVDSTRREAKQYNQKILDSIGIVVKQSKLQIDRCEFLLSGVESLREAAEKNGWAVYESGRVYLRGYCLSPGIYLTKGAGSVKLRLRFRVHRGDMDDICQWPPEHKVRLSVVHSNKGEECQLEMKCWEESSPRPLRVSIRSVFYETPFLNFSDLTRDGYVHDGQLRVIFELL